MRYNRVTEITERSPTWRHFVGVGDVTLALGVSVLVTIPHMFMHVTEVAHVMSVNVFQVPVLPASQERCAPRTPACYRGSGC